MTLRTPLLLPALVILSCASQPPRYAGESVCDVAGYQYVEFEELVLNLPRYGGADILVDGFVKSSDKRCKEGGGCDCSADPLLHDGYARDVVTNQFLLAPGPQGSPFACQPDASCKMACTPGPNVRVRVAGTLARVVEDEGEAVINVLKACEL